MRNLILTSAFILCFTVSATAQGRQWYIDSLKNKLAINPLQDTNRAIDLYRLCFEYSKINYDTAEKYGREALKLSMELDFQKGIGAAYNNIGLLYEKRGDDVQALRYYTLALDAKRKSGDPKSIASTLNNIGVIYKKQEYYAKALDYYREAISLNKLSGNREFLLINYYNLANCHKGLGNGDSAIYYYEIGTDLALEIGQYDDYVGILYARGNYHIDKGQYETGLYYVDSARKIMVEQEISYGQHIYYEAKGRALLGLGKLDSAEIYLNNAWDLVKDTRDFAPVSYVSYLLSELYYQQYLIERDTALLSRSRKFLLTSYSARDSTVSTKRLNTIFELVTEDLVKQKDAEIEAVQREKQLTDLRAENERQFKNFMIAITVAVALLLVVLWLRYRKNKILNLKLAEQNIQIESKNKEIIDSITYAKRLQEAILPPPGYLKQFFAESFILYLPKDIVAGDFYWSETSGDRFFIVAADCTGHGVPGAMVSVVCANALDRAVKEFGLRDTAKILDKTKSLVIQSFEKSSEMVNDGMDVSLLSLSLGTPEGKAQWSGANNPLWIVRGGELIAIKGDKQPVGRFENSFPFSAHEVELRQGDWIYLFTDGFADQFGGSKGKKYKYAQLQEKLISMSSMSADQQREALESTFTEWKGGLEQVDDICIIGIRI